MKVKKSESGKDDGNPKPVSPLIGSVKAFQIFPDPALGGPGYSYSTGGVGLRNRGAGGIEISGVTAPVAAAYVYWAVLTNGAAPPAAGRIRRDATGSSLRQFRS